MSYIESELKLERSIIIAVHLLGGVGGRTKVVAERTRQGAFIKDTFRFTGFPDLTFFYKNHIYFIEVKSKKGMLQANQKLFQKLCDHCGIKYILATSVPQVIEQMTGSKYIEKDTEWEKWKEENIA